MKEHLPRLIRDYFLLLIPMVLLTAGVFPMEVKRKVREKQSNTCADCGLTPSYKLEIHHIVPARYGGTDNEDNAVGLCVACHEYWDKQAVEKQNFFFMPRGK